MSSETSFFKEYLNFVEDTECPKFYHRWCALSGIGAFLGRGFFLEHGHFTVNPNMYTMLVGTPGARKSTAIKIIKGILVQAGYKTIAADKTTKEKFMLDLHDQVFPESGADIDSILDSNLWGTDTDAIANMPPAEMFIAADEFNDFLGLGNLEFISLLGNLWDYNGVFENKIKNGKSLTIPNPTINILGGNTPTGFAQAFPPEIIGQGFFSRLIMVYASPTGKKIAFPKRPDTQIQLELAAYLGAIKNNCAGAAKLSPTATKLLEKIYNTWEVIEDPRFSSYSSRRFPHLLKLCLIMAASRLSRIVEEEDVIHASTVLLQTEHLMPRALGEFGKAKDSDVSHRLMEVLHAAHMPVGVDDLFKACSGMLSSRDSLMERLMLLTTEKKIINTNAGFLAVKAPRKQVGLDIFNPDYLTKEELEGN